MREPCAGQGSRMHHGSNRLLVVLAAVACAAVLVPIGASGHDGGDAGDGPFGNHHRHHRVLLLGTVSSVDPSSDGVVVSVTKATRAGKALVGDDVEVAVRRVRVADTNGDDKSTLADVGTGDKVVVKTRRRFIDSDANTVSAAKLVDLTHRASRSGFGGDGRHCDGDRG